MARFNCRHLLGCPGANHLTTRVATFRSKVEDPICRADYVELVLDDYHRVAMVH